MSGKRLSLLLVIVLSVFSVSCIFQNEPLKPNLPPEIQSFSPPNEPIILQAPSEKVTFSIEASDPDRDELTYVYFLSDSCKGSGDSVLCNESTAEFHALKGGAYCIQGRVNDGATHVLRNWFVTVVEESNEPPEIISITPDMDSLSCVVGSTIEFRIGASDEKPHLLRYAYYVNGEQERAFTTSAVFNHRFPENGRYEVQGVIWDFEYQDSITWYINVIGDPDTVLPGGIYDLEGWTGDAVGTVRLSWTAPGDDGYDGRCLAYRVHTATQPILTEEQWHEASVKYDAPEPGVAGTVEEMTVRNLYPGTFLYATARAVDDFGNLGPIGNCISLLVRGFDAYGTVFDAMTGFPVDGIVVSAGMLVDTTGTDGRYLMPNLPKYSQLMRLRDENITGDYGDFYDMAHSLAELTSHFELDFYMVPVAGMHSTDPNYPKYDDFLDFLKDVTGTSGWLGRSTVYKGWHNWPLKVYNPPMIFDPPGEYGEIDLQAEMRGAMASWEDGTGCNLFIEVSDPLSADVTIVYFMEGDDKHTSRTIEFNEDGTPDKKEIWIFVNNTLAPVWIAGDVIFAHELGHMLGFGHSDDLGHLMIGHTFPVVRDPTIDEMNLMQVIYHIPTLWDGSFYLKE
ncbi:MAG: hypothetical protein KOO63_00695 [Bacteroidales bacterium]|nr:hypothetical protein [Candidatus Latescibacterota bacterium]